MQVTSDGPRRRASRPRWTAPSYTFNAKEAASCSPRAALARTPQCVTEVQPEDTTSGFKTTDMPGRHGRSSSTMAERTSGARAREHGPTSRPTRCCDPISGAIELIADARFDGAILAQPGRQALRRGTPAPRRDERRPFSSRRASTATAIFNGEIEQALRHAITAHIRTRYEVFTKTGHPAQGRRPSRCIADFFEDPGRPTSEATIARVNDIRQARARTWTSTTAAGLVDLQHGTRTAIIQRPFRARTTRWAACSINPKRPKCSTAERQGRFPASGLRAK